VSLLGGRKAAAPILLCLLIGLTAVVAHASGDHPVGTLRCGPHSPQVRTVARSPELRVYQEVESGDGRVFACGPALSRPVRVGPSPPGGRRWFARIGRPVVVRDYWMAAVELQVEGTDWGSTWLRVFEARTHHLSRCEVGGFAQTEDRKFRRLILSPKGNLAWAYTQQGQPVLGICDRRSGMAILDDDPALEIDSVELDGSLLRWTDSSGDHSRQLP
jgi:hypothetical protein